MNSSEPSLVLMVVVLSVMYLAPIGAVIYCFRRGHKKWGWITLGLIPFGLGLFAGIYAIIKAREPMAEQPEKTEADRIRARGQLLTVLATIIVVLVAGGLMITLYAIPAGDAAYEKALRSANTSVEEVLAARYPTGPIIITGLVVITLGYLTFRFVGKHFNNLADNIEREAGRLQAEHQETEPHSDLSNSRTDK
jgi:hypothetical protein